MTKLDFHNELYALFPDMTIDKRHCVQNYAVRTITRSGRNDQITSLQVLHWLPMCIQYKTLMAVYRGQHLNASKSYWRTTCHQVDLDQLTNSC